MRWFLPVLAGCGRIGFGDASGAPDASIDASDASRDGALIDTPSMMADCKMNSTYSALGSLAHTYKQPGTKLAWDAARADCAADGAILTIIDDAPEASLVGRDWIGITDVAVETAWVTVHGNAATFLPWAVGEPGVDTLKNCGRLEVGMGTFSARRCDDLRDYSCECE